MAHPSCLYATMLNSPCAHLEERPFHMVFVFSAPRTSLPSTLMFFSIPTLLPHCHLFLAEGLGCSFFGLGIKGNFDPLPKQLFKNRTSRVKNKVKGIFTLALIFPFLFRRHLKGRRHALISCIFNRLPHPEIGV